MSDEKPDRFLRLSDVLERTTLGKTQIYALIEAGAFPRWIPLSARRSAWSEREVTAWIETRKACAKAVA
jgi:prophage regulatory protein